MEKLKLISVAVAIFCSALVVKGFAQSTPQNISLSLNGCLEYAKQNNITLKQAQISIENSASEELIAKGAFLPTISGSLGQSLSSSPFGESTDGASYGASLGVDLSMSLYSGGSNRAQLQKSEVGYSIAESQFDEISSSLEISITKVYIEILYAIDQIEVAKQSLDLSLKSEQRGRAFLEAGSINKADLAQLESATASSQYDVVVAQTVLNNLYVSLKQLLEISQDITLTIESIPITEEMLQQYIPSVEQVYQIALTYRPEIQSSKLSIESAELDKTIAKSGYLPKLSLTAGAGINYNTSSSFDFSSQLRNNFSTSAGVNLSIPIFSANKNSSNVAIAQNNIRKANLALNEAEKDLYQTIESLHTNAVNAQSMYAVSQSSVNSSLVSMELITEQFDVGLKTTIELITEQDNYNKSCQQHLINKYQLILNKALLDYYQTNEIMVSSENPTN